MSKDASDTAETQAPKKSKKMLIIMVLAVVVLGGGAGAYFTLFTGKAEATEVKPVKGAVLPIKEALTINLADAHYLKMGFALQMTEEAGKEEIDTAEAVDLAIEQYTGMKVAELETGKGREKAKADLLEKIKKAYNKDGKNLVMGIYFTQYVTQ